MSCVRSNEARTGADPSHEPLFEWYFPTHHLGTPDQLGVAGSATGAVATLQETECQHEPSAQSSRFSTGCSLRAFGAPGVPPCGRARVRCGSFPHPPGWGSCFSAAPWRRWAASLAAACPWPREDVSLYSTRIIIFAYGTARVDNLQGVLPRLHNLAKKAHLMQSRAGRAARERRGGV